MRMTAATVYRDAVASMERASERLVEFQKQIESGKRISKPMTLQDGQSIRVGEAMLTFRAWSEAGGITKRIRKPRS